MFCNRIVGMFSKVFMRGDKQSEKCFCNNKPHAHILLICSIEQCRNAFFGVTCHDLIQGDTVTISR